MNKKRMIAMILSIILLAGCAKKPSNENQPHHESITVVTVESGTSLAKPLLSGWSLTQKPVIDNESLKLAVLGFQLSETRTTVIYATIGIESAQMLKEYDVSVVSNSKQVFPLSQVQPVFTLNRLELGVMDFQPRKPGSNELYLRLIPKSSVDRSSDVIFAKFYKPPGAEGDLIPHRMNAAGIDQGIDVAGYKIVFKGWGLIPQIKLSDQYNPTTPWMEVPENVSVSTNASFSIKNTQDEQTEYVALQLLSDGNAFAASDGKIYTTERIVLPTPTPQPVPYPGLDSIPYP